MMIIFAYLPYGLAEGIKLSGESLSSPGSLLCCFFSMLIIDLVLFLCLVVGIMAILFSGIVMSHYTHHNLSPVTQILMQQTLRTVAFMCGQCLTQQTHHLCTLAVNVKCFSLFSLAFTETCVFAFLGLSIFSFPHKFELSFVIWCIVSKPLLFSFVTLVDFCGSLRNECMFAVRYYKLRSNIFVTYYRFFKNLKFCQIMFVADLMQRTLCKQMLTNSGFKTCF